MTNFRHDLVTGPKAEQLLVALVEGITTHPIPSAEAFRNAVLGENIFAVNPLLNVDNQEFAGHVRGYMNSIVAAGQMVDFGFVPNEVIKAESHRARHPFEAGELLHPYDHWLAVSAWELGCCGYFFTHFPDGKVLGVETYGVALPGLPPAIIVNDFAEIEATPGNTRTACANMVNDTPLDSEDAMRARGANLLDPLVTFLRFLADASIPIVDVPAPEKLNKIRAKHQKHLIPAHARVETRDYVSLVQHHHSAKGEALGGHHASPVAHWRRAHQRHLKTGNVVPVRSSKVNWREAEDLHRLFYRMGK